MPAPCAPERVRTQSSESERPLVNRAQLLLGEQHKHTADEWDVIRPCGGAVISGTVVSAVRPSEQGMGIILGPVIAGE